MSLIRAQRGARSPGLYLAGGGDAESRAPDDAAESWQARAVEGPWRAVEGEGW